MRWRRNVRSPKRIVLLTQWFEPEPTVKGLVLARELVRRGFDVEVVTGFPNYPEGSLYPGYRMSWCQREVLDGVQVTRLPLYPSHDSSPLKRIANYVSFMLSATIYCLFQAKPADLVYVYQLPTLGVASVLIRAFRGWKIVFDIADMWPDTLKATGMVDSERVLNTVGHLSQWVYRNADALVTTTPGFRSLLLERGVPAEQVSVIYNWCDESSLNATPPPTGHARERDSRFNIVFAGNLGKAQALTSVLEAAATLAAEDAGIVFTFLGSGVESERLKAFALERRLSNVRFLPRVAMDKVAPFLQEADAVLVHLKADPLFSITIPGKTQAYMAMGKPVLMATPGDAATLVREARCGIEALPENPDSIAEAARQLARLTSAELAGMGERAKAYYRANLGLSVGVDKFVSVFEHVSGA